MVVRINPGRSVKGALSYNERKVAKGQAELLLAVGFPSEGILGFTQKLKRFEILNELAEKVRTNTLHISLNFPPDEILSDAKMKVIAQDYMEKIGFGQQPFLVYRHHDTKHPHLHIVTTTIQENGRGIALHNLVKRKSEPARKTIEQDYGLIVAETRKKRGFQFITATQLLPVQYGKEEVKHALTSTLHQVLNTYRYTSMEELNAILRHFHVVADRGNTHSRTYQHKGLVYSVLNAAGDRIGQAVKASDIYGNPTLKSLEKKFAANQVKKIAAKDQVLTKVSSVLDHCTLASVFSKKLQQRGVLLHVQKDRLGAVQQVLFVDHYKKVVFSDQELGIPRSRIVALRGDALQNTAGNKHNQTRWLLPLSSPASHQEDVQGLALGTHSTQLLLQALLGPDSGSLSSAGNLPRKKKKKRKPPL